MSLEKDNLTGKEELPKGKLSLRFNTIKQQILDFFRLPIEKRTLTLVVVALIIVPLSIYQAISLSIRENGIPTDNNTSSLTSNDENDTSSLISNDDDISSLISNDNLTFPTSTDLESSYLGNHSKPIESLEYIWIGSTVGQFSESEFNEISSNYNFVIIDGLHCYGDRDCQNDTATKLKNLNSDITILAYHNNFIRRSDGSTYGEDEFDDDWYLRDLTGQKITAGNGAGWYVDFENVQYMDWAIKTFQEWLSASPWDGLAFDRTYEVDEGTTWKKRIGINKINSLNASRITFMNRIRDKIYKDLVLVYNGLKDTGSARRGDQSIDLAPYTEGIQNEFFCHHPHFGFDEAINWKLDILKDVITLQDLSKSNNLVLYKVSTRDLNMPQSEKNSINEICYASYLLGYRPGYTSYKFGFLFVQHQLGDEAVQKTLNLTTPLSDMKEIVSNLFSREFKNGFVVVNFADVKQDFKTPVGTTQYINAVKVKSYKAGDLIAVQSGKALYLLKD